MKKLICIIIAVLTVTAALPAAASALSEIDAVSLTVTAPRPGTNSYEAKPDIEINSQHVTADYTGWLYGPDMYTSGDPYIEFKFGETYYMLVTLKADDGFGFKKFAASRTFDSDYIKGDYLRLKISVKAMPGRIGEVEVSIIPPAAGTGADEVDALTRVAVPKSANYTVSEASWYEIIVEDLYGPFDGTFENGGTYYMGLVIDANDGFAFNQGGPYGYTTVSAVGGKPLRDQLAVTNYMDDQGNIRSYGTVMIEFTVGGLVGDVNGDGDVNMKDVLLLRKIVAGVEAPDAATERRADVDGSGDVNMKDVLLLRKIVAGAA